MTKETEVRPGLIHSQSDFLVLAAMQRPKGKGRVV